MAAEQQHVFESPAPETPAASAGPVNNSDAMGAEFAREQRERAQADAPRDDINQDPPRPVETRREEAPREEIRREERRSETKESQDSEESALIEQQVETAQHALELEQALAQAQREEALAKQKAEAIAARLRQKREQFQSLRQTEDSALTAEFEAAQEALQTARRQETIRLDEMDTARRAAEENIATLTRRADEARQALQQAESALSQAKAAEDSRLTEMALVARAREAHISSLAGKVDLLSSKRSAAKERPMPRTPERKQLREESAASLLERRGKNLASISVAEVNNHIPMESLTIATEIDSNGKERLIARATDRREQVTQFELVVRQFPNSGAFAGLELPTRVVINSEGPAAGNSLAERAGISADSAATASVSADNKPGA